MDNNYSTQPVLVELLLRRDPKGCQHLCESYSSKLYGYIIKIVNDAEAAEQLLDMTFKRICKNIHEYKQSNLTFLSWSLQLARAESIDYLYIIKPKTAQVNNSYHTATESETAIDDITVLNMIHQGYKVYEVAEMLNMPVDEVKTSIRNAMKQKRSVN
ncbi:sigma factor [Mucilaginibacter sp.]|uniref:RNA polymerase sigma factor n=1 Tax=Mucilaginibacter sp. TaxID=1882438 RepID=UPI0025FC6ECB|nr:sigma factor [Mucilaginibacter sp.]